MKKIIIFVTSLQPGGVSKTLIEAMRIADIENYDITVYSHSDFNMWKHQLPSSVKVIIDTDKTHYYRRPVAVFWQIAEKTAKLFKAKKAERRYAEKSHAYVHKLKAKYPAKRYFKDGADVVIAYTMALCAEMAMNVKSDKKYVFFHSSDPDFHSDIIPLVFNNCNQIFAVGKNVENMLKENHPAYKDKIRVVENFIEQTEIKKLSLKDEQDFSKAKKTVLSTVIRIDKEKGANISVDAARILKDVGIEFTWFIVGDGSCRNEIEKQITNYRLNENVIVTGFVENPYPFIQRSDIYVHCALEESFGLSILEALLLGKPVVSTKTMGANEVLADGEYGILCDFSAEAVAQNIIELLDDNDKRDFLSSKYLLCDYEAKKVQYREKWNKILNGELL